MKTEIPRHVVWSTDELDVTDSFQRSWYIRQVLLHGRAEDVRTLNLDEVSALLPDLNLPPDIEQLWHSFLEWRARE
jgi:hypothetical protein